MKKYFIIGLLSVALPSGVLAQDNLTGAGSLMYGHQGGSSGSNWQGTGQVGWAAGQAGGKRADQYMKKKGIPFLKRQTLKAGGKFIWGKAVGAAGIFVPETAYSD